MTPEFKWEYGVEIDNPNRIDGEVRSILWQGTSDAARLTLRLRLRMYYPGNPRLVRRPVGPVEVVE